MATGGSMPAMRGLDARISGDRQLRNCFRDRLPDPVRLHRHVHLCEFPADRAAAQPVADGARAGLFRLPAVDDHDAAGRPGRAAPRAEERHSADACAGDRRACRAAGDQSAVVLAGMALVAVGTFLAQAIATGHVGRTAKRDKAAASGIYLASYYAGGLVGSFVLGQVFDRVGWTACVAVLVAALIVAIGLARALTVPAN